MKILMLLSILFVCSIQPLVMILSLILVTMFYSYYLYNIVGNYWYSYMMLLIVLSGILVIFTYITSLISNEIFEMTSLMMFCIFIYLVMFWEVGFKQEFSYDCSVMSVKLWESMVGIYNLFIVVFLLMMMLMVVWLSKVEEGALRNM